MTVDDYVTVICGHCFDPVEADDLGDMLDGVFCDDCLDYYCVGCQIEDGDCCPAKELDGGEISPA